MHLRTLFPVLILELRFDSLPLRRRFIRSALHPVTLSRLSQVAGFSSFMTSHSPYQGCLFELHLLMKWMKGGNNKDKIFLWKKGVDTVKAYEALSGLLILVLNLKWVDICFVENILKTFGLQICGTFGRLTGLRIILTIAIGLRGMKRCDSGKAMRIVVKECGSSCNMKWIAIRAESFCTTYV